MVLPTVPIVAPRLSDQQSDEAYARINILVLRNPTLINMIDGCAITLPMHAEGEAPSGLSIAGLSNRDQDILAIASEAERILRR
jgi:aspartyl-tRNA(Asn)/glutamyl-tRNA(Gln) amidotransferase subunit A